MNDFLMHHGILGQKWGIRRYQYNDGSLTPEGRRHYGVGERVVAKVKEVSESHKKAKIDSWGKRFEQHSEKLKDFEKNGKNAKDYIAYCTASGIPRNASTMKQYERSVKADVTRSSYHTKLLKGEKLTPEEEKLRKQDNTATAIAVGLMLTMGAMYAYESYKQSPSGSSLGKSIGMELAEGAGVFFDAKNALSDTDFVLDVGKKFYRQIPTELQDMSNPHMYVATNQLDRFIYKSMLGAGLRGANKQYEATFQVTDVIKAPSAKKMVDIAKKLVDDPDVRDKMLSTNGEYSYLFDRIERAIQAGDVAAQEKAYRQLAADLNINIVLGADKDPGGQMFLKAVKDAGYNALLDLNDTGWTKQPMILLDAQNTIVQTGSKEVKGKAFLQGMYAMLGPLIETRGQSAKNKLVV